MIRRAVVRRFLVATALAGSSSLAVAQTEATPTFGEVVDVRLVAVEAWVTDRDGVAVHGLSRDAFEVFEDGEPVELRYFSEIAPPRRGGAEERAESPVPTTGTPQEPTAGPESATATLVLYFDELNLRPAQRDRLVEALRGFLDDSSFPPANVLIARQTETLAAEAPFGSTREELLAALDRLTEPVVVGMPLEMRRRQAVEDLQRRWDWARDNAVRGDACELFIPSAAREVELYASEVRLRAATTLSHLAGVAGMLTAVPGAKTLVYVSDALDASPGLELLNLIADLCPFGQAETGQLSFSADLADGFLRLVRSAAANRVTIHALQPSGLSTGGYGVVEQSTLDTRALSGLQSSTRANDRSGLSFLANETGGRAYFDRNDLASPLRQIAEEATAYYSLAYEPPHAADGAEHLIEVRLRDSRLVVRHRVGYRDKTTEERTGERLQAALYMGILDNPLDASLGAGEVVPLAGAATLELPLHVVVPTAQLVFAPKARLALYAAAYDPDGKRRAETTARLELAPPDPGVAKLSLLSKLALAPGTYTVVVSLRELTLGEESILSTLFALRDPAALADGAPPPSP